MPSHANSPQSQRYDLFVSESLAQLSAAAIAYDLLEVNSQLRSNDTISSLARAVHGAYSEFEITQPDWAAFIATPAHNNYLLRVIADRAVRCSYRSAPDLDRISHEFQCAFLRACGEDASGLEVEFDPVLAQAIDSAQILVAPDQTILLRCEALQKYTGLPWSFEDPSQVNDPGATENPRYACRIVEEGAAWALVDALQAVDAGARPPGRYVGYRRDGDSSQGASRFEVSIPEEIVASPEFLRALRSCSELSDFRARVLNRYVASYTTFAHQSSALAGIAGTGGDGASYESLAVEGEILSSQERYASEIRRLTRSPCEPPDDSLMEGYALLYEREESRALAESLILRLIQTLRYSDGPLPYCARLRAWETRFELHLPAQRVEAPDLRLLLSQNREVREAFLQIRHQDVRMACSLEDTKMRLLTAEDRRVQGVKRAAALDAALEYPTTLTAALRVQIYKFLSNNSPLDSSVDTSEIPSAPTLSPRCLNSRLRGIPLTLMLHYDDQRRDWLHSLVDTVATEFVALSAPVRSSWEVPTVFAALDDAFYLAAKRYVENLDAIVRSRHF